MIVSHEHKFVFVRTLKTASSSIEKAIIKNLGKDDAWSWDRAEGVLENKSRNAAPHGSYSYIIQRFPEAKKYFSFCFDRNPWEKIISEYYFRLYGKDINGEKVFGHSNIKKCKDIEEAYLSFYPRYFFPNQNLYSESGTVLVNKVFQYEKLDDSLDFLENKFGLNLKENFPLLKSGFNRGGKPSEIFSDKTAKSIAEVNNIPISLFNYTFV
jgi:hypothetical protein